MGSEEVFVMGMVNWSIGQLVMVVVMVIDIVTVVCMVLVMVIERKKL